MPTLSESPEEHSDRHSDNVRHESSFYRVALLCLRVTTSLQQATVAFPSKVASRTPSRMRVPILIGLSAFPQGSMDGSDPRERGQGCANALGPAPAPGPRTGGSLPSPVDRPVRPRPVGSQTRKMHLCNGLRRITSAHFRRAKVRIDPLRRLRSPEVA